MSSLGTLMAAHSFETVRVGQPFTHTFAWRNDSTNTLVVRSVTTSCDCLEVLDSPKSIPPGGEESITVAANPKTPGLINWIVFAHVEGIEAPRFFSLWGQIDAEGAAIESEGLLVTPAELLDGDSDRSKVLFVDVRSPEHYRLARLPGSINLPLFTVKVRGFLRPKHLVLVDQGHNPKALLRETSRLKALDFTSVRALDGGFRAWQMAGGPVEGESVKSATLAMVSAAQFHAAGTDPGWLVVALTPKGDRRAEQPTPGFEASVPLDLAHLATDLAVLLDRQPQTRRLLLATTAGEDYEALEATLSGAVRHPLFYLDGGTAVYARYLERRLIAQNGQIMTLSSDKHSGAAASREGIVRTGGCCGRH